LLRTQVEAPAATSNGRIGPDEVRPWRAVSPAAALMADFVKRHCDGQLPEILLPGTYQVSTARMGLGKELLTATQIAASLSAGLFGRQLRQHFA
jgi:hypothetical protein